MHGILIKRGNLDTEISPFEDLPRTPEVARSSERSMEPTLGTFRGNVALPTPGFQTFSLPNWKTINFCFF